MDTIKIRLQLVLVKAQPVSGVHLISEILRKEGVAALWKGNVPAEYLYIFYGASQFTSYSVLNRSFGEFQEKFNFTLHPLAHSFVVGCGTGIFSTLITYPFDLLRTRLAANDSAQFLSMSKIAREIYQDHGMRGFLAGIGPSMLSIVASSGFFFCTYSLARDVTKFIESRYHRQVWAVEAVCGFVAGATSKALTFPLDTIRKRLQMLHHKSSWLMLVDHWRHHGLRGFYRGFGVSLLKTAPTSALSVSVYEYSLLATQKLSQKFNL